MQFRHLPSSPATASGSGASSPRPASARPRFAPRRSEPGFLAGVLEYLAGDERLLPAFAAEAGIDPADVGKALAALGGHWEREIP